MNEIKDGTESVRLVELVRAEKVELGASKTPGKRVYYKIVKPEKEAGKECNVQYLLGKLPEAQIELLKGLKAGSQLVVVKHKQGEYWNLKEFKDASTYVEKAPSAWGGKKGGYEKKEYDTTGIKVGAARNNAVAILAATGHLAKLSIEDALNLVDEVSLQIVLRQEAQESKVRGGGNTARPVVVPEPEKLTEDHFTNDFEDDDIGF